MKLFSTALADGTHTGHFLYADTREDAHALDQFFRQFKGKTIQIEERESENPALMLRFAVVETTPVREQDNFYIIKRRGDQYWGGCNLGWTYSRHHSQGFRTVTDAKVFVAEQVETENPKWFDRTIFAWDTEIYYPAST